MRKFSLFFIIVFFSVDLFYASEKDETIINTTNINNTKENNIINEGNIIINNEIINDENIINNEKKESLENLKQIITAAQKKSKNSKVLLEELSKAINDPQPEYSRKRPGKAEVSESEYMNKYAVGQQWMDVLSFRNLPYFSTYSGDGASFFPVFTCELDYFYFSFFPEEMLKEVLDFLQEHDISPQDFKIFLNYQWFSDEQKPRNEQEDRIIFRPHFFLAKDFLNGRFPYSGFNYNDKKEKYLEKKEALSKLEEEIPELEKKIAELEKEIAGLEKKEKEEKEKEEKEKEKNNLNINQEIQKKEEEKKKKEEEKTIKEKEKNGLIKDLNSLPQLLGKLLLFPQTKCIICTKEDSEKKYYNTLEDRLPTKCNKEWERLFSKKVYEKLEKSSSCCSSCCECLWSCLTKKKEPPIEQLTKKEENVIINDNVNDSKQVKRVNSLPELRNKRSGEKKDLKGNVISNNENVLGDELLQKILGKRRYFRVVDTLEKTFSFHNGLISSAMPRIGVNMTDCTIGECYLYFSFAGCPKTSLSDDSYMWGKAAMTIHFFFVSDEFYDFYFNGSYKSIEEALNFAEDKKHSDVVKFLEYISPNK